MRTEQERFWEGDFGDDYTDRNAVFDIGSSISFMAKIIGRTDSVKSAYEIGTDIGVNLDAIRALAPNVKTSGCEINKKAANICRSKGHDATNSSVFDLSNVGHFYCWSFLFDFYPRFFNSYFTPKTSSIE